MVRVGISVEGETEERFVKRVLAPYLRERNIFVVSCNMKGVVNLDKVRYELKSIAHGFDCVTTFYDFYGFQKKDADDTKASLEEEIRKCAHQSIQRKLIPYIQMHEFEGLLFSCPESVEIGLNESGVASWAAGVLRKFNGDPEQINDSPVTAPSKRLKARTGYRKTTHAPNIAERIGVERIRAKCAGFNEWLGKLEALAEE